MSTVEAESRSLSKEIENTDTSFPLVVLRSLLTIIWKLPLETGRKPIEVMAFQSPESSVCS